jgi:excisionase family DNA binding protein
MSGTQSAAPKYATVKDAAAIYNMHPQTLRRYIAEGRLTGYRVGPRNLRVNLEEVEATLVTPIPAAGGDT